MQVPDNLKQGSPYPLRCPKAGQRSSLAKPPVTRVLWECRRRLRVDDKDGSAPGYDSQQGKKKLFHDDLREGRKQHIRHNWIAR
jgi:hypothetical protein